MNLKTPPKVLFFLLLIFASSASFLWAKDDSPLDKYRKNYYSYRKVLEEFKLAREEYLKWKTLASRDSAVEKSQKLLSEVAEALSSYFSLLKASVESQSEFNPAVKELSLSLLNARLDFLSSFRSKILEIDSLGRLEEESLELEEDYKRGELEADFVKSALKMAKLGEVTSEVETLSLQVRQMVEEDKDYPQRERILGDWVFKISGKLELLRGSQNELWEKLVGFSSAEDYEKGKILTDVSEERVAVQGLVTEVVDHLLEIVRIPRYE